MHDELEQEHHGDLSLFRFPECLFLHEIREKEPGHGPDGIPQQERGGK